MAFWCRLFLKAECDGCGRCELRCGAERSAEYVGEGLCSSLRGMKRRIRRGGALLLPMHGDVLLLQGGNGCRRWTV